MLCRERPGDKHRSLLCQGKKEGKRVCLLQSSAKVNETFKFAITVNNEMIFMPNAVCLNRAQVYIGVPLI